jgi:ferredoxin
MTMVHRNLRRIRHWISATFLVLVALVFLDIYGLIPAWGLRAIVYVQFIPSLIKTLTGGTSGLFTGFVLVLVLTVLFGRVYCSFLCPLGTTMDLMIRARAGKKRFSHSQPFRWMRYVVLVITVVVFLSGSLFFIDLLDPYSIFGRVMANLVRPLIILLNNGLSRLVETAGFYGLSPVAQLRFPFYVVAVVAGYLLMIIWLSIKRGRLYCNTLCPVGAILGIVSRLSVFRLALSKKTCTGCGMCERNCKAECIDVGNGTIDSSRCVGCFNCLAVCPADSIGFSMQRGIDNSENPKHDADRRNVIRMVILLITGFPGTLMAQVKRPLVFVKNKIPVVRKHPVTPPGSISIAHFTGACTACYLCVTRCPGKVIEPGMAVYGKVGVLMPHLSNRQGYCNFQCTVCGEVCPTGAILPLTREEKKQAQVGRVHFIRENCIVITQKTECGACSEHCPTKAVNMVVENGLRVPVVNPDICVGCGACEYACPSLPHKSIYVEGNPVHGVAKKPKTEKIKAPSVDEDFPF